MENDPAETAEKVFFGGSEAGEKFVSYLVQVMDRKDVVLNAPSTDARVSEIRLVDFLDRAGEIGRDGLNEAVSDYVATHWLYRQAGSQWAKGVAVYWGWFGEENIVCTDLQRPIVAAVRAQTGKGEMAWTRI